LKQCWGLPPEAHAEFVWGMEAVREGYQRPVDPQRPLVGLAEISQQRLADRRPPRPMQPGKPERDDDEEVRHGTAHPFMCLAPRLSWRPLKVTAPRTRIDGAEARRAVIDVPVPDAETVGLVRDNRNTHGPARCDEAVEPAEARRLAGKRAIHSPPQHGRGWNMAEIEWSVFDRQGLDRRLPHPARGEQAAAAWETERNTAAMTVDGRFTTADARIKLKRLYP